MNRWCLYLPISFAALSASAELSVSLGASSSSIDTEAVTNVAFSASSGSAINMRMNLLALPSNNAEVIFGRDEDNDGMLSADEEMLLVGWDCGAWRVVDCRDQNEIAVSPGDSNNNKAFWRMRSNESGLDVELNGALSRFFTASACDITSCNMVKLICRGCTSPNLRMRHPASRTGFRVILR